MSDNKKSDKGQTRRSTQDTGSPSPNNNKSQKGEHDALCDPFPPPNKKPKK